MVSRRSMRYALPGILLIVLTAFDRNEFSLLGLVNNAVLTVLMCAMVTLVVKTRTSTRAPRSDSASAALTAVLELGAADAGTDPGWSWQAMTRRQKRTAAGEQLAEVVWDGREFFVDSTPAQPGRADVLAYCIDVTMAEDPDTCLARLGRLAATARSWSPAGREGCWHTVEGRLADEGGFAADVIVRIRVDELKHAGSSRVRVVLTVPSAPSGVLAVLDRRTTKADPLIGLPRTARTIVAALEVADRYETTASAASDMMDNVLLQVAGIAGQDEFADDMLFVHRERLAKAGRSTVSRVAHRVVIALLGVISVFVLIIVIATAFL